VGNADRTGGETPSVSDISVIIENLFGSGSDIPCIDEADIDLSGGSDPGPDDITVSDISDLIDNLFGSGAELPQCP